MASGTSARRGSPVTRAVSVCSVSVSVQCAARRWPCWVEYRCGGTEARPALRAGELLQCERCLEWGQPPAASRQRRERKISPSSSPTKSRLHETLYQQHRLTHFQGHHIILECYLQSLAPAQPIRGRIGPATIWTCASQVSAPSAIEPSTPSARVHITPPEGTPIIPHIDTRRWQIERDHLTP